MTMKLDRKLSHRELAILPRTGFPGPEAGEGESTNSGESNGAPLDRGRI